MPQASKLHQEAGKLPLPFPAACVPLEETKCLPWGKQSWQQEAEGCWVEKKHAQPCQGAFPGPLTRCQGPVKTAPASILTSLGAGSQAFTSGLLPAHPREPLSSLAAFLQPVKSSWPHIITRW